MALRKRQHAVRGHVVFPIPPTKGEEQADGVSHVVAGRHIGHLCPKRGHEFGLERSNQDALRSVMGPYDGGDFLHEPFAVFELEKRPVVGHDGENFIKGGNGDPFAAPRKAGPVVNREMVARIEGFHLGQRQILHGPRAVGCSIDGEIMDDNHFAVFGELEIALKQDGGKFIRGFLERQDRVFRPFALSRTMGA